MRNYFLLVALCAALSDGVRSTILDTTAQAIRAEGYQAEIHHVTTHDGYRLQMDRIPYPRHQTSSNRPNRPVVFAMHGLMSASSSYIALGHEYSLAYNLADAGFDVWLGNARGNIFSRYHESLNPDDDVEKLQFFDFTWEEIGMIDVTTMIDYVLNYTGQEKLHYIGHSQGGTVFLVMASMRPEYNEKLASVHLLAGVGYMDHFPNTELSSMALLTDIIYSFAVNMGLVEVNSLDFSSILGNSESSVSPRTSYSCFGASRYNYLCELIGIQHIMRSDIENEDENDENFMFGGAALKQIAHYGQNIRDSSFRRWNYGVSQNLEIYDSREPPRYDLGLITSNVTMHYTINDNLLDERDVLAMAADMPNCRIRRVARDDFLHEDFVAAKDSRDLVNVYIIEDIREVTGYETVTDTEGDIDSIDNIPIDSIVVEENEVTDSASSVFLSSLLSSYLIIHSLSLAF